MSVALVGVADLVAILGERKGGYRRREMGDVSEGGASGELGPSSRSGFGRGRGASPP